MKTKVCSICNEDKDINRFMFRRDTKKYRNQCMDCLNKRTAKLKKTKRKNDIEFVKREREYCRKWRNNYPEKDAIRKSVWRAARPEYDKEYYAKNSDNIKRQKKEWNRANPERAKIIWKRARQRHPENKRASERKRRAAKQNINESYSKLHESITLDVFESKCFKCSSMENITIDHHFPLSKGNALTLNNAVILCRSCNASKNALDPSNFYTNGELSALRILLGKAENLLIKR